MSRQSLLQHRNHIQFGSSAPQGSGLMVFAHGFGCDQTIWEHVVPAFRGNFQTLLYDHVGCGQSDLSAWSAERYADFTGYANDLIDILEAFADQPVTYVGHSVAGAIGITAAVARPDLFRQLVLIGPSPRYVDDLPDYQGGYSRQDIYALLQMMELNHFEWAGFLAPRVMGNPDRPELAEDLKRRLSSANPQISRQFAEVTFLSDIRSQLPNVTVPTDILYCEQDVVVPVAAIEHLAMHIPGCRAWLLDASGHYPHMSHPESVIEAIHHCMLGTVPSGEPS